MNIRLTTQHNPDSVFVQREQVKPNTFKEERIMIALTKELQQAVQEADEQPIRLVDPRTNLEYVVLPAEIFDRVQHVFYDANPLRIEEQRALLVKVGLSVGWDDPEMDVYNKFDPRRDREKQVAECSLETV